MRLVVRWVCATLCLVGLPARSDRPTLEIVVRRDSTVAGCAAPLAVIPSEPRAARNAALAKLGERHEPMPAPQGLAVFVRAYDPGHPDAVDDESVDRISIAFTGVRHSTPEPLVLPVGPGGACVIRTLGPPGWPARACHLLATAGTVALSAIDGEPRVVVNLELEVLPGSRTRGCPAHLRREYHVSP
jgi:hypothetical protein